MNINISNIKFFFLLILFLPKLVFSIDVPSPKSRPEIKVSPYKDVFEQVKKQNWAMAIAISRDYSSNQLTSYIKWLDASRPGTNRDFQYLTNFFNNHKEWPSREKILKNIESSVKKTDDLKKIISWYEKYPPITSKGSIDYLEALIKENGLQSQKQMIKNIWINKNLTYNQQRYFINKYSKFWNQDDNWKRFERLIYEGKNVSARRTLNRIKGDLRKLGEARLALSRRSPNVSNLINKVPLRLKSDPGLVYERLRWRRKAKLDTAVEFLISPPEQITNVRNWWINSRIVIRRLINKKQYTLAYQTLKKHNLPLSTPSGQEAEWLAGWVSLTFLKNSKNSLKHFKNVFENSTNINFKAKAAYWISESYKSQKNQKEKESKWLAESSKNEYNFYGQNSALKLGKLNFSYVQTKLSKPKHLEDLLIVIDIILRSKQKKEKTLPFFVKLLKSCQTKEEKNYVMNKANNLDEKSIITKLSRKLQTPSFDFSYPLIEKYIPGKFKNSKSTMALIHAITHQESNFRINAYSSAGARGLMQLMPFTAKKVAKDLKIKYFKKALTRNPQYNIILGTTYINQMLKRFDNSLPMALAAYNAGPGRVKIWNKRYGDPRNGEISYVNWIESIPISETRYYVKKVISNLRIYQKKYNVLIFRS